MNKELYIKKQEIFNSNRKLSNTVNSLNEFIINNEKIFKKVESIEALKIIKEYLVNIEKELKINDNECRKISRELFCSCSHEITIKKDRYCSYECLVCNRILGSDIPKESLISIDTNNDYQTEIKILKTFKDIVNSDKDLLDTINDALEEFQYESKIKVYRRQS